LSGDIEMASREEPYLYGLAKHAKEELGGNIKSFLSNSTSMGKDAVRGLGSGLNQLKADVTRPFISRKEHSNLFDSAPAPQNNPTANGLLLNKQSEQQNNGQLGQPPALSGDLQQTATPNNHGVTSWPSVIPGANGQNTTVGSPEARAEQQQILERYHNGETMPYNPNIGLAQPTNQQEDYMNLNKDIMARMVQNQQYLDYSNSLRENGGNGGIANPNPYNPALDPSNTREVNPVRGGPNAGLSQDRVNQIRLGVQTGEPRRQRDFNDQFEQNAKMKLMYGDPLAERSRNTPVTIVNEVGGSRNGRGKQFIRRRSMQSGQSEANAEARLAGTAMLNSIQNKKTADLNAGTNALKEQGLQQRFDLGREDGALARNQAINKEVLFQKAVKTGDYSRYNQAYNNQGKQPSFESVKKETTDNLGNITQDLYSLNKQTGEYTPYQQGQSGGLHSPENALLAQKVIDNPGKYKGTDKVKKAKMFMDVYVERGEK